LLVEVVVSVFVAEPAGVSTRLVDLIVSVAGLLASTFTLVDVLGAGCTTVVEELGAVSCTTVSFSFVTTGSFTTVVVVPAEPLVVAGWSQPARPPMASAAKPVRAICFSIDVSSDVVNVDQTPQMAARFARICLRPPLFVVRVRLRRQD